jgi:hypothetical protein
MAMKKLEVLGGRLMLTVQDLRAARQRVHEVRLDLDPNHLVLQQALVKLDDAISSLDGLADTLRKGA